jgi:hypothetical protein
MRKLTLVLILVSMGLVVSSCGKRGKLIRPADVQSFNETIFLLKAA